MCDPRVTLVLKATMYKDLITGVSVVQRVTVRGASDSHGADFHQKM